MYKVIIADGEPLIRAGLGFRNNWEAMGFEVAAILEDGTDVMKFLENNRADVLLTDTVHTIPYVSVQYHMLQ